MTPTSVSKLSRTIPRGPSRLATPGSCAFWTLLQHWTGPVLHCHSPPSVPVEVGGSEVVIAEEAGGAVVGGSVVTAEEAGGAVVGGTLSLTLPGIELGGRSVGTDVGILTLPGIELGGRSVGMDVGMLTLPVGIELGGGIEV